LCHAEQRTLYGKESFPSPSRFVGEIPAELTRDVRVGARRRGAAPLPSDPLPPRHPRTPG
jgi:DNA helicase-2/ATP-dependent DNA helicase PcrA